MMYGNEHGYSQVEIGLIKKKLKEAAFGVSRKQFFVE